MALSALSPPRRRDFVGGKRVVVITLLSLGRDGLLDHQLPHLRWVLVRTGRSTGGRLGGGGGGAAFGSIGGRWLVREEAVDAWFRSRCAQPSPFTAPARAGLGAPTRSAQTAWRASSGCSQWRGEADERPQARQAVRGQVD